MPASSEIWCAIQNASRGAFQRGARLHVSTLGGHLGGFRLRQQTLVLDDEETGGGAHFILHLLGIERLLRVAPGLDCRLIRRAGAPQGDHRVLHFQPAPSILQLAQAHLRLPKPQFIARQVRLGDAVADGQRRTCTPTLVGGVLAREHLIEHVP